LTDQAIRVVDVEFLAVVDRFSTSRTDMLLPAGNLLTTGAQVFGFRRVQCAPVVAEPGIS